jgi:hypothetical protein
LLALEPPPQQEISLLEEFLRHHPRHRFARAFNSRLETVRMVALLSGGAASEPQAPTAPARAPLSLGDYLIRKQLVTPVQIAHAEAQQQALEREGVKQSLGTLLLMYGDVQLDQLAVAFAETSGSEGAFGSFGDYLIRNNVLTATQVGQALARQAARNSEAERAYAAAQLEYEAQVAARKRTGFLALGKAPPVRPQRRAPVTLDEVLVETGLLPADEVAALRRERQRTFESLFT